MKKLLVLLAAALLPAGCASIRPVATDIVVKNSASFVIGQPQERNMGEPMVVEANLRFHKAPVAVKDYQPPGQLGTSYAPIRRGMVFKPYGRLNNGDTLYTNPNLRPRTMYGKPVDWAYCIALNAEGVAYGDAACGMGLVRKWPGDPEGIVEVLPVYREGSVKRELIYNGKTGTTIKLIYREYRYDFNTPSISEDLRYDLAEGSVIKFRRMEIEVLEARGSSIKYIIRSTMDGSTAMQGLTVEPDAGTGKGVFGDI